MPNHKPATLKDKAYEVLRSAIVGRRIRRDQIYSEKWFADSLSISRTPVREALLQLRAEGLVEIIPNRGVVIRTLTEEDARRIFQMRTAIEGYGSAFLAEHSGEPDAILLIDQIGASLDRCKQNFNHEDELFIHIATIEYLKNPLFTEQFLNMRAKIDMLWYDVIGLDNRREEVLREHMRIYEAICAGDAHRAWDANRDHNMMTLKKLIDNATFCAPEELRPAELLSYTDGLPGLSVLRNNQ